MSATAASAFVPLPIQAGVALHLLGPPPDQAAIAVEPLVKLDEPVGFVQAFVAGLCGPDGRLIQPMEILLPIDPATVVPPKTIPPGPVLRMFAELPQLRRRQGAPDGLRLEYEIAAASTETGPLLYCRKRHCVFVARSPSTAKPLARLPHSPDPPKSSSSPHGKHDAAAEPLPELCSWEAPAEGGGKALIYGAIAGTISAGEVLALERLILDQGEVVRCATDMGKEDASAAAAIAAAHTCCLCPERERCYPAAGGYAYAPDRLVAISAAAAPLVVAPLGEWRLNEAGRIIGGLPPGELLKASPQAANPYESWRSERAAQYERWGPARLLSGENDGRELLELARAKLALMADVVTQLDAYWKAAQRPHLCWNDDTVRCLWREPVATPAAGWGFQPILRKAGLQPLAPFDSPDGRPLPWPPAFSQTSLLPPEGVEAGRYFDETRPATVFVKTAKADGATMQATVLLEEFGVHWEMFCTGDALHISGPGWTGLLSPLAVRDKNDGAGLPFGGKVTGKLDSFKPGQQFDGCACRWYPRYGEATDLHAVGMLLFETLMWHEEWTTAGFREALLKERANLVQSAKALPIEQRDGMARRWIAERTEVDAPAALWTRRNLFERREDRNATRLDAFPPLLWQAIVTLGVRLITPIPGFSFCDDRACAAPRTAEGLLLPLLELRGLIALLDDHLFGRTSPAGAVKQAMQPPKKRPI